MGNNSLLSQLHEEIPEQLILSETRDTDTDAKRDC